MKKLSIKLQALILVLMLLAVALFSAGCSNPRYRGEYPQLCSVAWSNIPTLTGSRSNGEVVYDPEVFVLATDSYGRVLFSYTEDNAGRSFYVLIMQCADEQFAYYYPDDCYTLLTYEEWYSTPDVNAEEVTALKALNDWERPIDESKLEGSAIIDRKPSKGKLKVKDWYFEQIVEEYYANTGRYVHPKNVSFVRFFEYVKSDGYGREMYLLNTGFEEYSDKTETWYSYTFLVILQPDKSYDLSTVVVLEPDTMPQQVKTAKQQTGWNTAP